MSSSCSAAAQSLLPRTLAGGSLMPGVAVDAFSPQVTFLEPLRHDSVTLPATSCAAGCPLSSSSATLSPLAAAGEARSEGSAAVFSLP